jgi:uncharacterized protein (DUF2141 family)
MNIPRAVALVALVALLGFSWATGPVAAASNASITADPVLSEEQAEHTVTATVGPGEAGEWSGIEIRYPDGSRVSAANVRDGSISVIGIDRGGDDPGTTVDVSAKESVRAVSSLTGDRRLRINLGNAPDIAPGDEVVVRYRRVVNPRWKGTYTVEVDLTPFDEGGVTTAPLTVVDRGGAAVTAADHTITAGDPVVVRSVTAADDGFLVLYDADTANASPIGNSSVFAAGTHDRVELRPNTSLETGDYRIVAHSDTDGNGVFDTGTDQRFAGERSAATARVTVKPAPAVTFDDQVADDSSLRLANVTLPDGGFVVLYNATQWANGTGAAEPVGHSSYRTPGGHGSVTAAWGPGGSNESNDTVGISAGSYVAVLHRDDNGNRTFDGAAVDPPYEADGAFVSDRGRVRPPTPTPTPTSTPEPASFTPVLTTEAAPTTTPTNATTDAPSGTATAHVTSGRAPGFGVLVVALAALLTTILRLRRDG